MSPDPLYEPLGLRQPRRTWRKRGPLVWLLPVAVLLIGAGVALRWQGGARPEQASTVVPIEVATPSKPAASAAVEPETPVMATAAPASPPSDGTTVEVQNGVKIIRFNPAASPASISIPVAAPGDVALKPAPDPRVSEATSWGTLPRSGPSGARPAAIYARIAPAAKGPELALVLGGMGADQLATADAARRLPPATSFAFAADVADATPQVTETRRAGHEVFLTLAATPGPVPAVGPKTVGGDAVAVAGPLDPLHRRMARFAGYVGIMPDSPGAASPPERQDIATRGLLLVDRALGAADTPRDTVADIVVDASQGHAAVRAALDRLVDLAHTSGAALGIVDRATLATDDVAALTGRLASERLTLVPATALVARKLKTAGAAQ